MTYESLLAHMEFVTAADPIMMGSVVLLVLVLDDRLMREMPVKEMDLRGCRADTRYRSSIQAARM